MSTNPFRSFWMAGFECASHIHWPERRMDLIAESQHDRFALLDYRRLQSLGIRTVRDGVRWHLIEAIPRQYNFDSVWSQVQAANETGTQVIWDLFHYGWPDYWDVFSSRFISAFAEFAAAFASWLAENAVGPHWFVSVNEPSYLAWAAGEVAYIYPFATHRSEELKNQLIRASVAGMEAIWQVQPQSRFLHVDPLIHVTTPKGSRQDLQQDAKKHHEAQYDSKERLIGRQLPQLGGEPKYLDVVGVSYYPKNQWLLQQVSPGEGIETANVTIPLGHLEYVPLRDLLREVYQRYSRPLLIAETGTEGSERPSWLEYIAAEVKAAQNEGIPIYGICWYPILNHPGWDDGRHCHHGLWDYAEDDGSRQIYEPLATVLSLPQ